MCVHYVYMGALIGRKKVSDPLELQLKGSLSCIMGVLELNSGPVEGQQMLATTEPFR